MNILIGLPTSSDVLEGTFKSILQLDVIGHHVEFKTISGLHVSQSRSRLIRIAMTKRFDYLLYVDFDNVLPCDTIHRLVRCLETTQADGRSVAVSTGWYRRNSTRSQQSTTIAINVKKEGEKFGHYTGMSIDEVKSHTDPFPIDGCGFGTVMVDVNWLLANKFEDRWFDFVVHPNGTKFSEDYNFCSHVTKRNGIILCDPNLECGHTIAQII